MTATAAAAAMEATGLWAPSQSVALIICSSVELEQKQHVCAENAGSLSENAQHCVCSLAVGACWGGGDAHLYVSAWVSCQLQQTVQQQRWQ